LRRQWLILNYIVKWQRLDSCQLWSDISHTMFQAVSPFLFISNPINIWKWISNFHLMASSIWMTHLHPSQTSYLMHHYWQLTSHDPQIQKPNWHIHRFHFVHIIPSWEHYSFIQLKIKNYHFMSAFSFQNYSYSHLLLNFLHNWIFGYFALSHQ
jgi:hypothetical protein